MKHRKTLDVSADFFEEYGEKTGTEILQAKFGDIFDKVKQAVCDACNRNECDGECLYKGNQ